MHTFEEVEGKDGYIVNTRRTLEKAHSGQMAIEALKAFSQHLNCYVGELAHEYKDFDFDWTDQDCEGPVFNVVVEVLKQKDTVVCEASVFNEAGVEFSRVSYEALKDDKARAVIADYVLALQEGR